MLADVTAHEAHRRPASEAHSIWELVLHMTAWTREVTRRVHGNNAAEPEMGDWPAVPTRPDEQAWRAALAALDAAHVAFRDTVRGLDAARLTTRVGDERNPPLGTGVTIAQTINGLVQHDAYHSGQIAILKKLLRSAIG